MRLMAGILAALGWSALILQFRLVLGINASAGIGVGETLVRFFSISRSPSRIRSPPSC